MNRCLRHAVAVVMTVASTASLAGCGTPTPTTTAEATAAPQTASPTAAASLTYCSPGGVPLTMNVFPPHASAAGAPAPVAMFVHGGGWTAGNAGPPGRPSPVEAALVARGFFVVSINYRLAPQYPWPAQIQDAKCAVRFLRAGAERLHIDGSRIGVWGSSAGGHLVSLLGLAGPTAGWDVGEHLDQSSAVEAVVDEWGPADLTTSEWAPLVAQHVGSAVFQVPFGSSSPVLTAASPVTYVHSGAPPFLIIQGAEDPLVHPVQSQELAQRVQAAGDSVRLLMVANAGHGLAHVGTAPVTPSVAEVNGELVTFFVQHLA